MQEKGNFHMSFIGELVHPKSILSKVLIVLALALLFFAGSHGYLTPIQKVLDSEELTLRFLEIAISPYKVLKALLIIAFFLWVASFFSVLMEKQIKRLVSLRASNRELLSKAFTLFIYFVFGVAAIDMMGVDLSALTVLGGAIGIGIGFGLQKITSNFISGLILLMEKSVEAGDLIELSDNTQGFVRQTGARYSLVETFDGKEVMVPNEDFITGRVINWTLTNKKGRVEINMGVSYGSDLEKVKEILLEAAEEHPRCSTEPAPQCFLDNFGESSVDFVLFFWVEDVTEGRREPKSDVLFAIWHKFAAAGIEIPFPQRDLHIKSGIPSLTAEKTDKAS